MHKHVIRGYWVMESNSQHIIRTRTQASLCHALSPKFEWSWELFHCTCTYKHCMVTLSEFFYSLLQSKEMHVWSKIRISPVLNNHQLIKSVANMAMDVSFLKCILTSISTNYHTDIFVQNAWCSGMIECYTHWTFYITLDESAFCLLLLCLFSLCLIKFFFTSFTSIRGC